MRIRRLEIYGYGKWVDTTFELAEDVHLFYGMNEAGKSTLMSFIHSILFGFPTRNSTFLRYEPRVSSRYGGKIIGTDPRFGEVVIERIHGKVTGDVTVTLEDGTTGSDEMLETILHGMTRESFQSIFSFSLTDIENVHKLDKNQLSRYLLNIGAHGTEHYLELVDQFQADADKRYRPSGRVLDLNKQLDTLEKQEQKLNNLEKENARYLSLIEQLNAENDEIETLEAKQKQLESELADLVELKKQWHVFEEIQTLEAELSTIKLPPLKEDGRYLLDEYKREKADFNEQLQDIQIKINEAKQTFEQAEMIESYENNKEAINQLEDDLPEIVEQLRDYENVTEKRAATQKEMLAIEEKLKITDQPMYPLPFEEAEEQAVQQWQQQEKTQNESIESLKDSIQTTKHELNLKNQKLDQYEALMWDYQEFKEVEEELQEEASVEPNRRPALVTGVAGLALLVAAFFMPSPLNWLFGIAGLLVLVWTFIRSKTKAARAPNERLQKEYDKQVAIKKEWQDLLGEVDALQADHQTLLTQEEQSTKTLKDLTRKWQNLLERHYLPMHFPLAEADTVFEHVSNLHELVQEDEKLTARQSDLRQLLEADAKTMSTIIDQDESSSTQEQIAVFREYLSQVKAEIAKEQEKLNHLNALKQEEKQLKDNLEHTQTKINTLIETAGVKEETAFIELYQQKEKVDAKKSRLHFLKENAPTYDADKELPSRDALEGKESSFHKEIEGLKQEKNQALREMTNTKLSIEHLEKDGTYTEELQVFENEKATAQRLLDEWVSDKLAAGMIKETLNQVTKDRFAEIIADAEQYFHLLTDGEYERIVFKEDELFVQMRTGQVVDVRVLSRGTAEPLYVAIRLAYIQNTQDMMELPVIMDDPFVNFDDKRRQNMYELLERLGADLQIIYFTFDEMAMAYFKDEQMTDLEMRKKNGKEII